MALRWDPEGWGQKILSCRRGKVEACTPEQPGKGFCGEFSNSLVHGQRQGGKLLPDVAWPAEPLVDGVGQGFVGGGRLVVVLVGVVVLEASRRAQCKNNEQNGQDKLVTFFYVGVSHGRCFGVERL